MGVGQRGPVRPQFPGGDSVLSPRATDHAGVGLKMVEYVLASSPTGKDLDARMANLSLRVRLFFLYQLVNLNYLSKYSTFKRYLTKCVLKLFYIQGR